MYSERERFSVLLTQVDAYLALPSLFAVLCDATKNLFFPSRSVLDDFGKEVLRLSQKNCSSVS